MLRRGGKADIASVVSALRVSEATARRLLSALEADGRVIRTHGGAMLAPELGFNYSYRLSAARRSAEKAAIGRAAADLVRSGDRIFLDSGTTILRFAEALAEKIRSGELEGVSVVTNSLAYLESLPNCCQTTLAGGDIRTDRMDVAGPVTEKQISKYCFDKAFFGADAIDAEKGLMTSDDLTAAICETAIANSKENYVLADSEKFSKTSYVTYSSFSAITAIITDSELDVAVREKVENTGARIIISHRKPTV
jgi:DeoR/GlpR family transcriptional regulator of sugar metabolism